VLGNYQFFPTAAWPPPNSAWCVVQTNDSFKLVIVDAQFIEHDVIGWCFVGNCEIGGPFGECDCLTIPTEDTSWGAVKSLY
jgi:hypothetical protein